MNGWHKLSVGLSTHTANITKKNELPVSELYKHMLNQSLYFTCTRTQAHVQWSTIHLSTICNDVQVIKHTDKLREELFDIWQWDNETRWSKVKQNWNEYNQIILMSTSCGLAVESYNNCRAHRLLALEAAVSLVIKNVRPRWHVKCNSDLTGSNTVRWQRYMELEWGDMWGRLQDTKIFDASQDYAQVRNKWRKKINSYHNPGSLVKWL